MPAGIYKLTTYIAQMIKILNNKPILKASFAVGLITLSTRLLGYIEKVILAFYFGTGYQVDVYTIIISIVTAVFIFIREVIEPGFLNVFLKRLNDKDGKSAWALFNKIARLIIFSTIFISIIAFVFPHIVIDLFAPGFKGEKREMTVKIIQSAFPATVFLSLSALTNITLNGLKRFGLPALGDFAFKAVILLCLLILFKYTGIYSIIYGLILGAFIKILIHSAGLYRNYSLKKINLDSGYALDTWNLTWPLLIGVTFSQISGLVDNIFASYMQEGALSALSYSKKIIDLPVLLFPYILSTVVFPYFSELAIAKEKGKLSVLFLKSIFCIVIVFLPLSVFFYMFSYEIIEIIFKRGAFNEFSTMLTAKPFAVYSLGMTFFALETVLVIFYYSNSNTKTPIFIGVLCVIENIILTYFLIDKLGYLGIALALVISKVTKIVILSLLVRKSLIADYHDVMVFIFKVIFSTVVFGVVISLSKHFLETPAFTLSKKITSVAVAFLIGTISYILLLFLLRLKIAKSPKS